MKDRHLGTSNSAALGHSPGKVAAYQNLELERCVIYVCLLKRDMCFKNYTTMSNIFIFSSYNLCCS